MVTAILTILVINLFSFLMFAFRRKLEEKQWWLYTDLGNLIFVGGAFGAFIAMIMVKEETEYEMVYKIAVPVSMLIQVAAVVYLCLFDLGIVK